MKSTSHIATSTCGHVRHDGSHSIAVKTVTASQAGVLSASSRFSFRYFFLQCFLVIGLLTCVLPLAQAQSSLAEAPKKNDVRILIDISGSMKKNDPANLRRPALDMIVKLLPEGSHAGVWTFGKYVNMLVKHREVDAQWKQEAAEKTQTIDSIAQYTNIGGVLDKAAYDKNYSTRDTMQTHFILLTDGMVDIDRNPALNQKERERILNQVLPEYQKVDYKIHTISLSDNADKQLMDRLAVATDGQSVVAKNADELMRVFLQVFDQAVPKEELPFDGNSFVTDSSIEEFTALIFKEANSKPTEILAPDLVRYNQSTRDPSVSWYATDQYDLITIKQPLEGEWKVIANLQDNSRITVVSDLNLAVKPMPTNLLLNDTLDFSLALREENKIVNRAEFLELLDIDVTITQLESSKENKIRLSDGLVPGNGVYKTQLDEFKQLGSYTITALVDGKSFQRKFTHRAQVREAFSVVVKPLNSSGSTQYKVTVSPQIKGIDFDNTEVVGKLKSPSGSSNISPFTLSASQTWEWVLDPTEEGRYSLSIRMTTLNTQGQSKTYVPSAFIINHPQTDNFFNELERDEPPKAEPIAVAEPMAELPALTAPERSTPKPQPVKPEEEPIEDIMEPEDEGNMMQWILYGAIALINILIVVVIYIIYRKFFGGSDSDDDSDDEAIESDGVTAAPEEMGFVEPPMDEMNIGDLEEDDDEPPPSPSDTASELDAALAEDIEDPLADLNPSMLDDEDEDPEFDLDDFAPDSLDDDELTK